MSGRITTRLDRGLGWTRPLVVACCCTCGSELARNTNQAAAVRAARCRRCPACGSRGARRLPGTTSLATDLAVTRGRWAQATPPALPDRHLALRLQRAGRR